MPCINIKKYHMRKVDSCDNETFSKKVSMQIGDTDIAHVRKNENGIWERPHLLSEHLMATGKLSKTFAEKFGSGSWGEILGLAHDVGKGRLIWQRYIRTKSGFDDEAHLENKSGKIQHAIYGAELVENKFGYKGRFLSYSIAGHHSGLPDWISATGRKSSLQFQLSQHKDLNDINQNILSLIPLSGLPNPPWKFSNGLDLSLWIRMLYSCLVDADFLDTESYMDGVRARNRAGYSSLSEIIKRYNKYIKDLEDDSEKTHVNQIRHNVRTKCVQMAGEQEGIFSLSVPTGGGKTLSSLAFALTHAVSHGMDRVIYVIPYTSIIEQNAKVFRDVIGQDNVIEHHSNFEENDSTQKSRLACENWDAPFIVTTTVQFFESLFAAKPSRCRKLHNIVNSVVILDEAQLLPVELLSPILETMQLLVDHYHVTFVISTATQPAFGERNIVDRRFPGLKGIREIMGDNVPQLYDSLRRVRVNFHKDLRSVSDLDEIAVELGKYKQVLCVVSDRKSCRELYKLMPEGTYHLSALMCGEHRSKKIEEIKAKLKNNEKVRVISTQLVEAGVDFDFPVVYRSMAGLDSIAQAAGRCNREGKLSGLGSVVVFNAPKRSPPGILRKGEETARNIINNEKRDMLDFGMFTIYFSELYWKSNSLDSKKIISLLSPSRSDLGISFRTASEKFQIIDDSVRKTILVRYGDGIKLIDIVKSKGADRFMMRKLQRFTVSIYDRDFEHMLVRGSIEEIQPGIFALTSSLEYRDDIGLIVDEVLYDPEEFIQ